MTSTDLPGLLSASTLAGVDRSAAAFARREPFRHVVIDDFLDAGFAAQLLAQFPAFEQGNARNEAGELGGKSTIERIRALGAAYEQLDDIVRTREFLDFVGRLTGIPDLLYDPHYFGGGTHENRDGQDLDPHIDFNRHPIEPWHRRLNLIVYLNHEWQDDWGGSLELHSDPRSPDDRVDLVTPLYNRCVIFETTESSWHGFSRITLPDDRKSLSRKSIALYFYTNDRPADELAGTHSTVYVERPLPPRFQPGRALTEADVDELQALLTRRDQHLQRLYGDLGRLTGELERAQAALRGGRLGRLEHLLRRIGARLRR